jgi:hypothetical protein
MLASTERFVGRSWGDVSRGGSSRHFVHNPRAWEVFLPSKVFGGLEFRPLVRFFLGAFQLQLVFSVD